LPIADFQFVNAISAAFKIGNRKLAIGNIQRRQSAVRAHNALTACYAKAADLSVKFFGSNASASILP
jgi:hypothetical protein